MDLYFVVDVRRVHVHADLPHYLHLVPEGVRACQPCLEHDHDSPSQKPDVLDESLFGLFPFQNRMI